MANVGLNSTQLKEHYAMCIQLCSTNKINTKNAFGLHIIDYMNQLTKNQKDGNLNFKLVSSTLDVGTKIYSNRVDSVSTQAQKVASNLHHALDDKKDSRNEEDEEGEEGENEDQQAKKKAKQRANKRNKTIGTKESVTLTQLEYTGEQDQLFLKLSSTVDVGAANSYLIETLDIDSTYTYRIDSTEAYYTTSKTKQASEQPAASTSAADSQSTVTVREEQPERSPAAEEPRAIQIDISDFYDKFSELAKNDGLRICPRLDSFNFNNLNDDFDYGQNSAYAFRNLSTNDDNMLLNDCLDINDNLDDYGFENQPPLDGSGGDFGMQNEYSLAHKSMINSDNAQFMLGIIDALSDNPTDYCLFDKKITLTWAGHEYWRPNPVYRMKMNQLALDKKQQENVEKVKRTRKVFAELNFDNYQDEPIANSRAEIKLKAQTLQNWMNNRTLMLPEDFKREAVNFVTRFTGDQFNLLARNRRGNADKENSMMNQSNLFDNDDYDARQDDEENNSELGAAGFDMDGDFDYATQETQEQQPYGGPMPFVGDNLVDQPQIIPTINLPYTKFAKKIDVKRLKSAIWDLIQTNDNEINETRRSMLNRMEVDVSSSLLSG